MQSLQEDYPDDAKAHLKMLLGFLKTELPVTDAKLTEIENGRCEKIAFDKAWLLYPPNTAVYSAKAQMTDKLLCISEKHPPGIAKDPLKA